MKQSEKIRHRHRFNIFEQLEKDRALIKLHILDQAYERLTMVTDIRVENNIPYFQIDYPTDFRRTIAHVDPCRMHFEFIGSDNLKYTFKSREIAIINKEIYIRFPEVIHRLQNRKNFRISPLLGTKISLGEGSHRHEMSVMNISLGGVLGTFDGIDRQAAPASMFTIGNRLKDIELTFPPEDKTATVRIREAVVKRTGKNPETGRDICALQFVDIKKDQKRKLVKLIYEIQRDYLRRRIFDKS